MGMRDDGFLHTLHCNYMFIIKFLPVQICSHMRICSLRTNPHGSTAVSPWKVVHSFFIYGEHVLKKKTLTFSNFYSEFNLNLCFIEFL